MKMRLLLALLLIALPVKSEASEATSDWLATERFQATEDEVLSIPVKQLDKTWVKASVLAKERLSPAATAYLSDKPTYQFVVDADLNKDGKRDRAMVGVYEAASGKKGIFLLVVTEKGGKSWEKAFLAKVPGEPGYSALCYTEGIVGWFNCFGCDATLGDVYWDGKKYLLAIPSIDY
jgi:hypothetical protein